MTLELEEDFIGEEMHVVPSVDPDDDCNGKKKLKESGEVVRNENDHVIFDGYCNNPAGKGTDHFGEGRCMYHGGESTGAPDHNQNAQKHALSADPHHYHQSLDPEEKHFIEEAHNSIIDRITKNHGREPDFLDEMLARRVAIKLHMVSQASDYTQNVSGLVQVITGENGSHEEKAPLLEEIRRFDNAIIQNLEKLGVLEDPETQKADALDEWRDFVEKGGSDQKTGGDVIDVESEQE